MLVKSVKISIMYLYINIWDFMWTYNLFQKTVIEILTLFN